MRVRVNPMQVGSRGQGTGSGERGVGSGEQGVRRTECGGRRAECGVRSAECGGRNEVDPKPILCYTSLYMVIVVAQAVASLPPLATRTPCADSLHGIRGGSWRGLACSQCCTTRSHARSLQASPPHIESHKGP
jgi:hypothetical protein